MVSEKRLPASMVEVVQHTKQPPADSGKVERLMELLDGIVQGGWGLDICTRMSQEVSRRCPRMFQEPRGARQRDADDALLPPGNLSLTFWGILVVGLGSGWKSKEVGVGGRIGAM